MSQMKPDACPGCGGEHHTAPFCMKAQPVVMNYRFPDADSARRVARRDISLLQCKVCGLIYNGTFEPESIPYDKLYENRQNTSPAFRTHLNRLARSLIRRPPEGSGRVLEVGCGKGDFLRLLAEMGPITGVGYDTSYEGSGEDAGGRLQFYPRYVTAADIETRFDVIVCRHVVEHIGNIGEFLVELARMAEAAGDPLVVLETPRFEWIQAHGCLWDVFYEHCNYFTMATLAYLCERAGLRIVRHIPVFGGQYQWIEARLARTTATAGEIGLRGTPTPPAASSPTRIQGASGSNRGNGRGRPMRASVAPSIRSDGSLDRFVERALPTWNRVLESVKRGAGERPWAIWGAGAKGVALAHLFGECPPTLVIDVNEAKQGCVIPGTNIPVVGPGDSRVRDMALILIANPNYASEIARTLRQQSYQGVWITV